MEEKKEEAYGACKGPRGHGDHLCVLMERGLTDEIRRRSSDPAFACRNCEAQADRREDLCSPEKL